MERRNRLAVIHDILWAIQDKGGKIKPTHLLYKSNLSYKRLQTYMDDLKQRNLLQTTMEKDKTMIALTEQGYKFLQDYNNIKQFTDAFGL